MAAASISSSNAPASVVVALMLKLAVPKLGTDAFPVVKSPSGSCAAGDLAGAVLLAQGSSLEASATDTAQWLTVAGAIASRPAAAVSAALNSALEGKTFLCGDGTRLSVCDVIVASALRAASVVVSGAAGSRWQATCEAAVPWAAAAALASGKAESESKTKGKGRGKGKGPSKSKKLPRAGKLPGLVDAEAGVMTRFPPEPSGYLHIGHVKAIMVNTFYARHYKGKLLVRFDDTNPSKEKDEFSKAILDDLAALDVRPDVVSHTSDHFDVIAEYARKMLREGHAYMDDTPVEEMRKMRFDGIVGPYKPPATTPEENLARFEAMFAGSEDGKRWCMRANMDMSDKNKCCRDPVLFRSNDEPHVRTGTRYKAYPTYDFACPIVDAIEGVTHAMRTTEYRDRDIQYHILQGMLGVRKVNIIEFSRLNFIFTTLSKRKLNWFVENKLVEGWNDPRFPTVQGVLRRGVQVQALQDFIIAQGASKKDVDMEWDKFWAMNKKIIDPIAFRYFAISDTNKALVTIAGAPTAPEAFSVPVHPKDESLGHKAMHKLNRVWVEAEDAALFQPGEQVTLKRWGNIVIDAVTAGTDGALAVAATLNEAGDPKATKAKICWIPDLPAMFKAELVEFDNLITKPKLEEGDVFEDHVNPTTMVSTTILCEPAARAISPDQVIQLERRGYFRCDKAFVDEARPMVLFNIPDGKVKAVSALSTGLTSRSQAQQKARMEASAAAHAAKA